MVKQRRRDFPFPPASEFYNLCLISKIDLIRFPGLTDKSRRAFVLARRTSGAHNDIFLTELTP